MPYLNVTLLWLHGHPRLSMDVLLQVVSVVQWPCSSVGIRTLEIVVIALGYHVPFSL